MAARTKEAGAVRTGATAAQAVNEVRLVGRVAAVPLSRELPSGDTLWTVRVVVDRQPVEGARQRVDALECAVWVARLQRSVSSWRAGDQVEVQGALRRRFYRAGGAGAVSRVEVEVSRARLIRRAAT